MSLIEMNLPIALESVVWVDEERMSGEPCFAGTRVPIRSLFDYLEGGETIDAFLDEFPGVTREQIFGALFFGEGRLTGKSV